MNVTVIVICLTVLLLGVFACISLNDWCTAKVKARGPRGPVGAIGAPGAQGPRGEPAYNSAVHGIGSLAESTVDSMNAAINAEILKQYHQYSAAIKSVLDNLRLQGYRSFVSVPDSDIKLLRSYERMALAYHSEAVRRGLLGPNPYDDAFCTACMDVIQGGRCRCAVRGFKGPGPCPQGEKRPADRAPSGELLKESSYAGLEVGASVHIPEHAIEAMHQRQARNRAANSMIVHGD